MHKSLYQKNTPQRYAQVAPFLGVALAFFSSQKTPRIKECNIGKMLKKGNHQWYPLLMHYSWARFMHSWEFFSRMHNYITNKMLDNGVPLAAPIFQTFSLPRQNSFMIKVSSWFTITIPINYTNRGCSLRHPFFMHCFKARLILSRPFLLHIAQLQ